MIKYILLFTIINLVASLPISIYIARRGRRMQNFPHITPAYIYGRENHNPVNLYSSRIPRRLSLFELLIRRAKFIPQSSKKPGRRARTLKFRDDYNLNAIDNFDNYKYKKNYMFPNKYKGNSFFSGKSTDIFKSPLNLIKLKKMGSKNDHKNIFKLPKIIGYNFDKDAKNKNEIVIQPNILKKMEKSANDHMDEFRLSINKLAESLSRTQKKEKKKNDLDKSDIEKRIDASNEEQVNNIRLKLFEPSSTNSLTLNKDQKDLEKKLELPLIMNTSADEQRNDFKMHVYEPPQSIELEKSQKKETVQIRPANVVFQRKGQIVQSRKSRLLKFNFEPTVAKAETTQIYKPKSNSK